MLILTSLPLPAFALFPEPALLPGLLLSEVPALGLVLFRPAFDLLARFCEPWYEGERDDDLKLPPFIDCCEPEEGLEPERPADPWFILCASACDQAIESIINIARSLLLVLICVIIAFSLIKFYFPEIDIILILTASGGGIKLNMEGGRFGLTFQSDKVASYCGYPSRFR